MKTSYIQLVLDREKPESRAQNAPTKLTQPQRRGAEKSASRGCVSFGSASPERFSRNCAFSWEQLAECEFKSHPMLASVWSLVEAVYRRKLPRGPVPSCVAVLPDGAPILLPGATILRAVVEVERATSDAELWLRLLHALHASWQPDGWADLSDLVA